jgi:hypothetical protein
LKRMTSAYQIRHVFPKTNVQKAMVNHQVKNLLEKQNQLHIMFQLIPKLD